MTINDGCEFAKTGEVETEFTVFLSPFTVKASDVPVDIQLGVEETDVYCPVYKILREKMTQCLRAKKTSWVMYVTPIP